MIKKQQNKKLTKLKKIESKIFNARDKRFKSKKKSSFSDWVSTKYMINLRNEFNNEVIRLKAKGIKINYDFGDCLC